tara:strand:+ start:11 stop:1360 length:1350 start_codon:yes stop_codon:yes gene_type:complete
MVDLNFVKQDILKGSSKVFSTKENISRIDHFKKYMHLNKSYIYKKQNSKIKNQEILKLMQKQFLNYRKDWNNQPNQIIKKFSNKTINKIDFKPLCVDLEISSFCDLACPHCFREYIATPDKIMNIGFAKNLIDQIADLKIPSIKFNWRGEPLLHPKLPEIIDYAKSKGIIETIINTNATKLNTKNGHDLIKSGLDYLIYSFDGGKKETYEKYRPGRFSKNKFEDVYENIKNFHILKNNLKSKFPFTKIQMVLMKDTRKEIEEFYKNFYNIVDEVSVTQYSERGGNIEVLDKNNRNIIIKYLKENNLPLDTPYMIEANKNIYISKKRKTCKQLFQRLMVTYDGKVGMCCVDWGAKHNLGYVSKNGFNSEKAEIEVMQNTRKNKKGFELLKFMKLPKVYNQPKKIVKKLQNIWKGSELKRIRNLHLNNNINKVDICKNCHSKDTFEWIKIN